MLQSLELTQFKSFREARLPLGPFTLLVGTNASGKSNVRDALRFLHGCAQGFALAEIFDEKWGPGGALLWRGIRGGAREISWYGSDSFKIEAGLKTSSGNEYRYVINVSLEGNRRGPRVIGESLQENGQSVFETSAMLMSDLRLRFRGGDRRVYPSKGSVLPRVAEDEAVAKKNREAVSALLSELRGFRFLDLSPDAMREPATPGHQVLGDRGENLSSVLLDIVSDAPRKEALLGWLQALTPLDVKDLRFREDLLGRVLVHLVEANGHETSAASASDGTLRFLALAAALLSPESGQLYFFEEIDNGFHPTRLHLLLDVLEQATRNLGCQIVATTHHPQLLAFLSERSREDAVLIYRLEEADSSQAVKILDLPDIQRILATQDLGRLFASGWLEDTVEFLADSELKPAGRAQGERRR